mgnify:FL=1
MKSDAVYVFDADGVLIEPWGFDQALEHDYGIAPQTTRPFFQGPFLDCLIGQADLTRVIGPYLDEWGWPHSVEELITLWLTSENQPQAEVLSHVASIRHKGGFCALASNQEQRRARFIEQEMFHGLFDRFYFSCDLGVAKPQREYFQTIAQDLDVAPERIHFWDDTQQHVDGARQCGWNAYFYSGPDSLSVSNEH